MAFAYKKTDIKPTTMPPWSPPNPKRRFLSQPLSHFADSSTWFGKMHNVTSHNTAPRSLWASPAGKYRITPRLAALLPEHKTYVEPFAGSAAVLFAKPRSEVEVVSDIDHEIAEAFRRAALLDADGVAALTRSEWTGNKETFSELAKSDGGNDTERLRKFMYLAQFSFLKGRRYFSPSAEGRNAKLAKRIPVAIERLRGITVESGDYETEVTRLVSAVVPLITVPLE